MNHQSLRTVQEGQEQTAQVFPLARRMQPDSPHLVLQEFLTIQQSSVTPTTSTPWLIPVPHLLITPPLQRDQLDASTATAMGWPDRAFTSQSHPGVSMQSFIGFVLSFCWHFPSLAVQGQSLSDAIPWSNMYQYAESIHPPSQPMFPQVLEQSTKSCSEYTSCLSLSATLTALSRAPVAAKAQHEPQAP